jgi:hypothetical protein
VGRAAALVRSSRHHDPRYARCRRLPTRLARERTRRPIRFGATRARAVLCRMAVIPVQRLRGHARQRRTRRRRRRGLTRVNHDERTARRTTHGADHAQRPSPRTGPQHGTRAHRRISAQPDPRATALITGAARDAAENTSSARRPHRSGCARWLSALKTAVRVSLSSHRAYEVGCKTASTCALRVESRGQRGK